MNEEELPKWIQLILTRMTRSRKNKFLKYLDVCTKPEEHCRYMKNGTVSWSYGIERKDNRKYQYMPLSAMVKRCTITAWEPYSENRPDNLGRYNGVKIYYNIEPYRIWNEVMKKNDDKILDNTHGLSISNNEWRYSGLIKQRLKIKSMYTPIMLLYKELAEFRKMYRSWITKKLFREMINTKFKDNAVNMYYYSREHKKSKWVSKVRWGTLTVNECKIIAWGNKQAVTKLNEMIEDLDDDMTIVWDLDIGFDAIRTRTEAKIVKGNEMEESYIFSRDARSLGFLGHMFGLLKKERIRELEKEIIQDFAKKAGVEVLSPLINNSEMWKRLRNEIDKFNNYDGSNWQATVGLVLSSPISSIFYGWILLCSGTNTTSLEGILTAIMIAPYIWYKIKTMCSFGDDMMIDVDVGQGIKNFIYRDDNVGAKTFLGYDLNEERVRGVKVCLDNAEKMLSTNKGIKFITWKENIPDLQQKISLIIVYGFSDVTTPVQLNIDSKEYIKPSRIISAIDSRMWSEVVREFQTKYSEWW